MSGRTASRSPLTIEPTRNASDARLSASMPTDTARRRERFKSFRCERCRAHVQLRGQLLHGVRPLLVIVGAANREKALPGFVRTHADKRTDVVLVACRCFRCGAGRRCRRRRGGAIVLKVA